MKKISLIALIGLILTACTDDSKKLSSDNAKSDATQNVNKKDNSTDQSQALSKDSVSNTKANEIESLKAKYKYLRAKLVSVDQGDLIHHIFKDENGKEHDFMLIEDRSYNLSVPGKSDEYSIDVNPKYKNKYFDIFYKVEKHDLLGWGTKESCDVVKKLILVEQ